MKKTLNVIYYIGIPVLLVLCNYILGLFLHDAERSFQATPSLWATYISMIIVGAYIALERLLPKEYMIRIIAKAILFILFLIFGFPFTMGYIYNICGNIVGNISGQILMPILAGYYLLSMIFDIIKYRKLKKTA